MKKIGLLLYLFLFLFMATPFAWAAGKGQGGEAAGGWEKGKKKGWQSDVPPGIEEKEGELPPGLSGDKPKEEGDNSELEDTEKEVREKQDPKENKNKEREKHQEKEKHGKQ